MRAARGWRRRERRCEPPTRAFRWPARRAGRSWSRPRRPPYNALGDGLPVASQALSLSQNLYSGGGIRAATREAERLVDGESARLRLAEQDVLLDAVSAYTALVRDRRVLELAARQRAAPRHGAAAARDRERFGDLTTTDIHQAELRHAASTAERIAAEGALKIAEADYARVIGALSGRWTRPRCPTGSLPPWTRR